MTHDLSPDRLGNRADDIYAALVAAHDGLSDAESAALNARLILLLLNLVGDAETVMAAIERARQTGDSQRRARVPGLTRDPG